jgi:hypothetical protein
MPAAPEVLDRFIDGGATVKAHQQPTPPPPRIAHATGTLRRKAGGRVAALLEQLDHPTPISGDCLVGQAHLVDLGVQRLELLTAPPACAVIPDVPAARV